MRKLILLAAILALAGCAMTVTQPDSAAHGAPPSQYEEALQSRIAGLLRDPDSAKYQFDAPVRAYWDNGYGKVTWVGYAVNVSVNAKNAYGGYTGPKLWTALFSGNSIDRLLTPDDGIARTRLRLVSEAH